MRTSINEPLSLDYTLPGGQAFGWKKNKDGVWTGIIGSNVVRLAFEGSELFWDGADFEVVKDYLRLDGSILTDIDALGKDPYTAPLLTKYSGLRVLRQDVRECLFSFICSAANSIPKITAGIDELRAKIGEPIGGGYHAFPTTEAIAEADPEDLASIKPLAFRGRNLVKLARYILDHGGDEGLYALKNLPYEQAREELTKLPGVGKKIADCVCLFGLDFPQAVPVDTHVRQIAQRYFLDGSDSKTVTDRVYKEVREAFVERYGKRAGLAQQYLFTGEISGL